LSRVAEGRRGQFVEEGRLWETEKTSDVGTKEESSKLGGGPGEGERKARRGGNFGKIFPVRIGESHQERDLGKNLKEVRGDSEHYARRCAF